MISEEERVEIHKLVMEGVSKTKIAKIMGRSRQTIYAAIKQKPDPVYVYKAYLKRKL